MSVESRTERATALQTLYQSGREARWILDHFASRKRNRQVTTADRLHTLLTSEHGDITRGDTIECFKRLEEIGCGQFIIGRQGYPSRFEWGVSLVSVGKAAIGEAEDVEAIRQETLEEEEEEETKDEGVDSIAHRFLLRPECVVNIELPSNLTPREASRLAEFVKTLPFAE